MNWYDIRIDNNNDEGAIYYVRQDKIESISEGIGMAFEDFGKNYVKDLRDRVSIDFYLMPVQFKRLSDEKEKATMLKEELGTNTLTIVL